MPSGAGAACRGASTTPACSRAPSGSSGRATGPTCRRSGSRPSTGSRTKLRAGARVADVGCGHGASAVVMADAYPASRVWGFDFHGPSVETARQRAEEAGVGDRTTFEEADAKGYDGTFDLICFFDCLHDMGDPVGIARYAREHLDPEGRSCWWSRSPSTGARPTSPTTRWRHCSTPPRRRMCLPNSLSQEVGLGLGAQAGEARCGRCSRRPGSPGSTGRPRPRSTSSSRRGR